MSTNAIARRYAKALIQLAAEQGAVERYYTELTLFLQALESAPEAYGMLSAPGYGIEAKRRLVNELAGRLGISGTTGDFLLLLLDRKRIDQLSGIADWYRSFADDAAGIVRSSVTSALPLSEQQVRQMQNALEKATGKKIILSVDTDPSLIGGIVTRIGDKVFDGSIRTQLTKIHDILQKG
ncbi:MAG: F0F1 ATP synthase subunit delta [Geobacteraceae bacterium]|nr:F0F1 ATP synthase subunit delta [Geobacteraceae bacterium]